jgi:hypothetical protein
MVRRLEPILRERLQKLLSRLEASGKRSEVLQLHHVFKAYTSDVITEYAFGESFQFVDAEDYGKPYFDATDYFFSLTHVFGHFPLYAKIMQAAPGWLVRRMSPIMVALVDKQTVSFKIFSPASFLLFGSRLIRSLPTVTVVDRQVPRNPTFTQPGTHQEYHLRRHPG